MKVVAMRSLALLFASFVFVGCSGGRASSSGGPALLADLAPLADLASPSDLAVASDDIGGYLAGPYGPNVGDVVPNFIFKGYFAPTNTSGLATAVASYGDVSFNDARTSGMKFALVMFAGFS
jgi:hypothetical protein